MCPRIGGRRSEGPPDAPLGGCLYLVVRGTLTPRGNYGHLGKYDRQLTTQEVSEARTPSADEEDALPC